MEVGFPIPFHLIMPIWKSVTSLSSSQLYPNCKYKMLQKHLYFYYLIIYLQVHFCGYVVLGYAVLGYGALNTTSLDDEPGRCRRTDGKRCRKGAVTGHKYCERHMHRNRDSDGRSVQESMTKH